MSFPQTSQTPPQPEQGRKFGKRTTKPRKQRTPAQLALRSMRRRWYLLSIIPLVLVLAAAGYFFYIQQWTGYAIEKYKDKDLKNAAFALQHSQKWLPAERWIQPFNFGTVKVSQGAYNAGISDFEKAESLAPGIDSTTKYYEGDTKNLPPMCKIRINHAYTYGTISAKAEVAAEVNWNALNAAVDSAARATSKKEYTSLIATADEQKAAAVEQYTLMEASSAKSAELLEEYLCTSPASTSPGSAQQQRKKQEAAQAKLDAAKELEYPKFKEKKDQQTSGEPQEGANGDEQEPDEQTDQNSDDKSEQNTDPKPSESTDSQDQEQDPDGSGESEKQAPYTSDEKSRQEQLQERNKAGKIQREEADAWENDAPPSEKQW